MTRRIAPLLAAGALVLAACSSDSDGAPVTTGTTFTPVQGWSQTQLGNPNAVLTGDADHDGVIDELEYALGTNPQAPTSQAFSMVQGNPGSPLSLTFTRNLTATDLVYEIESSSTLTANGAPMPMKASIANAGSMTNSPCAKLMVPEACHNSVKPSAASA